MRTDLWFWLSSTRGGAPPPPRLFASPEIWSENNSITNEICMTIDFVPLKKFLEESQGCPNLSKQSLATNIKTRSHVRASDRTYHTSLTENGERTIVQRCLETRPGNELFSTTFIRVPKAGVSNPAVCARKL